MTIRSEDDRALEVFEILARCEKHDLENILGWLTGVYGPEAIFDALTNTAWMR